MSSRLSVYDQLRILFAKLLQCFELHGDVNSVDVAIYVHHMSPEAIDALQEIMVMLEPMVGREERIRNR